MSTWPPFPPPSQPKKPPFVNHKACHKVSVMWPLGAKLFGHALRICVGFWRMEMSALFRTDAGSSFTFTNIVLMVSSPGSCRFLV